jgi:hypothetical protein
MGLGMCKAELKGLRTFAPDLSLGTRNLCPDTSSVSHAGTMNYQGMDAMLDTAKLWSLL